LTSIISSCRPTPIPATGPRAPKPALFTSTSTVGLPLGQRLHDLVRTAGPAQVSGHHLHRDPGFRGELAGQLPQRVLAAGDEHQVRAIAGEEPSAG